MNYEESKLQQQCVAWFRAQYPHYAMLLVHPINEGSGHTQMDRKRQGIHKAEGAVAGVPDLILFIPGYDTFIDELGEVCYKRVYGFGIEMKTRRGRQSQQQNDFQKMFEAAGYAYWVVRDFEEFVYMVNLYISRADCEVLGAITDTSIKIREAAEAKEREHFYKVIGKKQ